MSLEFWKCALCGNVAIKPYVGGGQLACCGQDMALLTANSVDAATEKHVPVVTVNGSAVHVEVGSTLHPMEADHYITFICLETQKGYQIAELKPGMEPKADFAVAAGDAPVTVYEYCNKHGLWSAQV